MKEIKVVIVEPERTPRVATIEDKLEKLQEIVEGYIEVVSGYKDYDIVVNEEGKIDGLKANRAFFGDILVGTFFITKSNSEGEFVSLTDDETHELLNDFALIGGKFPSYITF